MLALLLSLVVAIGGAPARREAAPQEARVQLAALHVGGRSRGHLVRIPITAPSPPPGGCSNSLDFSDACNSALIAVAL